MEKHIVILLIFVSVLSEIFFNINETVGFILYSSLVAVCLLGLGSVESLSNPGKLIIVLMIIPIVRIIESFITLGFFWKIIISYSILLFLSFYYSVRLKTPSGFLSLKRIRNPQSVRAFKLDHGHKKENLSFLPLAIIMGVALGLLGNFFFSFDKYFWLIYLIPLIAYSEEILFRGMIQNLLEKDYGVIVSILITSLLYGLFSLGYGPLFALFIFFAGIAIGVIYSSTKNIFLAVGISLILHYLLFVLP